MFNKTHGESAVIGLIMRHVLTTLLACCTSFGVLSQQIDSSYIRETKFVSPDWDHWYHGNPSVSTANRIINSHFRKIPDSLTLPQLTIKVAKQLLGKPYAKGKLIGVNVSTKPILCLNQLDCYTLVDNTIALATGLMRWQQQVDSSIKKGEVPENNWVNGVGLHFISALEDIRYRGGTYTDFSSRLHYARDLITDNEKRGTWVNITRLWPNDTLRNQPKYRVIGRQADKESKATMFRIEDSLRQLPFTYIPSRLAQMVLPDLMEGDIIGIVPANNPEVEISHVGFVVRQKGDWYLLHASSQYQKVVIGPSTLLAYLNRKSVKGFCVIRLPDTVPTYTPDELIYLNSIEK
jgi:hypothetical protein